MKIQRCPNSKTTAASVASLTWLWVQSLGLRGLRNFGQGYCRACFETEIQIQEKGSQGL